MKIVKIISEWKKKPKIKVHPGYKMVEAVVLIGDKHFTRHTTVPK